jgi:hypothetical protein
MVTLQQQKRKFQGMNPSGMFRTNAPVIAVTARQQKENTPRDEPFMDVPYNGPVIWGYGTTAKRKHARGMNRWGTSRTNAQVMLRQNSKKRTYPGMNRWGTSRTNAKVIVVAAQRQKIKHAHGWSVEGHTEQMHKSLWLRNNSKKKTRPGMNRWGTSQTNAQVIVVTAQQQKREHAQGLTVEGHLKQMH